MDKRILLLIGGGHDTGVKSMSNELKTKFDSLFPESNIKVIDIDYEQEYMISPARIKRSYSNEDYDFDVLYNTLTHQSEHKAEGEVDIIIVCGCYALYNQKINELANLRVFVESDGDVRLINKIRSENIDNSEQLATTLQEYLQNLRPEMENYIEPTRVHAHLIIPYANKDSGVAIIVDGMVKIVNEVSNSGSPDRQNSKEIARNQLYDFLGESMDNERSRYYDLA
ncbi:putative uridine kinase DAS2 [Nakaseomyces glabratus]|uniref:Putative uridine kinase DAS2 n=1 Tax=Candida glabrata TaxID=5478 RepID=A0A0W0CXP0_CANGB|nr:Phosphoribulokinase / Uridine kinase family [Nakaseomyces glabratus]KAH7579568.1 Phosphoribulokinase / Uridine kinase family [Nakaseomyces glabratus]KAH7580194.1 Phosphoribulokinase / Uridine kinase family [Nakaseomyces glabratus]KAH7592748.1 Phosphoribulokinase / Uridine kinase family [Nakaseomyces glabratus]KAH7610593.1 Phosphoribulokinase / Uridine kinase family [Nakaseomyces glabratus]